MALESSTRESQPHFHRLPFRDIVPALATYYDNRTTVPLIEYKVDGLITAHDLQGSLKLPFELAFTEDQGEVVVSPFIRGKKIDPDNRAEQLEKRLTLSKLSGHTHNKRPDGKIINVLSLQDFIAFAGVTNDMLLLAHENGISHFQKSVYGLDGKPLNTDATPATPEQFTKLLGQFQNEKDFSLLALAMGFQKMDIDEQTKLAKEFIETTGMVVRTALWESEEVKSLVRFLNLQK